LGGKLRRTAGRAVVGFQTFGVDPVRTLRGLKNIPRFLRDLAAYRRTAAAGPFPLRLSSLFPVLADYDDAAGDTRGHYFHQDLWAARKVFAARPAEHVDVGSRIDGFVAHLLTFMPVTVLDIRALESNVEGLTFVQADATDLARFSDASVASISSLHAIEHFGLGRYGDPVDGDACFRAMRSLARVLAPGGRLYFSVPVGRERVAFNAHRIFAPATILSTFAGLELVSFAAVDDRGELRAGLAPDDVAGAEFACGLFEFTRSR
jgi:SAM-dependent methyltransferase